MCRLDFPFLGVEIIGAVADVLHQSERVSEEADLHQTTWRILWKNEGFMSQVRHSLGIGKLCLGERSILSISSMAWNTLFHLMEHFVPPYGTLCSMAWNYLFHRMELPVSAVQTQHRAPSVSFSPIFVKDCKRLGTFHKFSLSLH